MVDSKNKCLAIFHLQDSSLTQKLLVLYGTNTNNGCMQKYVNSFYINIEYLYTFIRLYGT